MKDESEILESEAKRARIMPLRSIHFAGTSIKDFRFFCVGRNNRWVKRSTLPWLV